VGEADCAWRGIEVKGVSVFDDIGFVDTCWRQRRVFGLCISRTRDAMTDSDDDVEDVGPMMTGAKRVD
jgi:hypothetical protein